MQIIIRVEPPKGTAQEWVATKDVTSEQLNRIISRVALLAGNTLKELLTPHTRSGLTRASIEVRETLSTSNFVRFEMGSWVRGKILYWLDRGRGAVRPVNKSVLRWVTRDGEVVFSLYSRPTVPTGIMSQSCLEAWNQISSIVEEEIRK